MKELNLLDIWRYEKPDAVESCYSSTHKINLHIDYFLVSALLVSKFKECQYNSIVISDHAAISLPYEYKFLKDSPK